MLGLGLATFGTLKSHPVRGRLLEVQILGLKTKGKIKTIPWPVFGADHWILWLFLLLRELETLVISICPEKVTVCVWVTSQSRQRIRPLDDDSICPKVLSCQSQYPYPNSSATRSQPSGPIGLEASWSSGSMPPATKLGIRSWGKRGLECWMKIWRFGGLW